MERVSVGWAARCFPVGEGSVRHMSFACQYFPACREYSALSELGACGILFCQCPQLPVSGQELEVLGLWGQRGFAGKATFCGGVFLESTAQLSWYLGWGRT